MSPGDGPRSDDASSFLAQPLSIKTSLFPSLNNGTNKGGCWDSHARSDEVECLVPCNLHRARITHVSADARIQGARSLSLFLRLHRALHRGIITRDDPLLVLPASPASRPPFLILFTHLGLNRHHPSAIYLYRKALDRVSANALPWKLGKKRVIGCGKRNVALYLLLLLLLVVVVVGVSILEGNIITRARYAALRGNVD